MLRVRIVTTIFASALLASCSEPVAIPSADTAEVPGDSDFETAELRAGHVRTRQVWVPSGYSLVDMNDRGDLLLGAAWLPKGRARPLAMPFTGRSINNHRQILGPGRKIFTNGRATELPDPCIPIKGILTTTDNNNETTSQEIEWNCLYHPVEVAALAENGDAITSYRQDAPLTTLSPHRYVKVWRARTQEWQTVLDLEFTEYAGFIVAISDTGMFAVRFEPSPSYSRSFVSDGHSLLADAICDGPSFAEFPAEPRAVNDAGEVAGILYCGAFGFFGVGVRWSSAGVPARLSGIPSAIDNYGNVAGIRDSDGHAVLWLVDGSVIDLSAAAGGQPASVRKFLKRGQVFGFVGTQPVIWRFGF